MDACRWIGLLLCCTATWLSAAPARIDQAWRDHDRALAMAVWTDQGEVISQARARIEAAVREGDAARELRARADYLSQVAPLGTADRAMAEQSLKRARAMGEWSTAFDLLGVLGQHTVMTHAGPIDAITAEMARIADQLGDPARQASIDYLQAMSAIYAGRSADAIRLLSLALERAPHEFRRIEVLLTRADAVSANPESPAALDSARADLKAAFALVDPERFRTFGFQGNSARARLERTAGNVDAAIEFLGEAVRLVPPSMIGHREQAALMTELSNALITKKRFMQARAVLARIARTDNLLPADRLAIAIQQARLSAELDGAEGVARSNLWLEQGAAELKVVHDEPRALLSFHRAAADIYERTGQYAKALAAWKAADAAARERTARANEKMRLEFQTRLDVAAKEQENAALRAQADLESERRLRWSWAFAIAAVATALLAAAWATSSRQRRRLADLSAELATRNAQLEERSSSRIRMLAAACHDLRQPAHALGMLAELGGEEIKARDPSRTWLQNIKRCSATLSEMLGELMDLSRLDGGHYEPVIDTVPLDELMQEVRLQYAEVAQRKGLVFDARDSGLHVRSDRQLLRRMVFNGVANAVKYTRTGRVTVQAQVLDGIVTLTVEDTGPGIPAEKLDQVFQDHVRLDPRQAVDGLGIGLSIVRRAGHLLGHTVSLQSVVGRGTRFELALGAPVVAVEAAENDLQAARPIVEGMLIALMENDGAICDAISALLRRWGFAVASGPSAHAVLTAAGGRRIDLIISDLHLDHGDGLDAITALRSHAGLPSLPALLVTGDLEATVATRAASMQVQIAHKPLPPTRLLAAVMQARQPDAEQPVVRPDGPSGPAGASAR